MSDHPRKAEDRLNTFSIAMIGGVAALLLWAGVIALQAYYARTGGALEEERATAGQDRAARSVRAEQLGRLAEYRRSGEHYVIPIERAMELVVRDARAGSLVPAIGPHDQPTEPVPGHAP